MQVMSVHCKAEDYFINIKLRDKPEMESSIA